MNEWSTPAVIIALIGALGLGNLAPKAWNVIAKAFTSRAQKERAEVDRLRTALAAAEAARDVEAAWRRRLQESLSEHRVIATNHGIPTTDLPAFPGRPELA